MHAGSIVVGLVVGAVLGVGGSYGIAAVVDAKASSFEQDSIERTLRRALGEERARVVRCHQSDGPFWVCRALTHPGTGKLYNITITPNGRCFTGVEAETAMKIDSELLSLVRGWRATRADCQGIELPTGAAKSTDPFAGTVVEAKATAFPATAPDSSECDPNYADACLDPESYDYDCAGGTGDGPDYTGTVEVVGSDVYDLDRDGDGIACD